MILMFHKTCWLLLLLSSYGGRVRGKYIGLRASLGPQESPCGSHQSSWCVNGTSICWPDVRWSAPHYCWQIILFYFSCKYYVQNTCGKPQNEITFNLDFPRWNISKYDYEAYFKTENSQNKCVVIIFSVLRSPFFKFGVRRQNQFCMWFIKIISTPKAFLELKIITYKTIWKGY